MLRTKLAALAHCPLCAATLYMQQHISRPCKCRHPDLRAARLEVAVVCFYFVYYTLPFQTTTDAPLLLRSREVAVELSKLIAGLFVNKEGKSP